MRPSARKAAILEFVDRHGQATVDQLADLFATSPETVRRDLGALAEAELLRKVHGGARRIGTVVEGRFEERMASNPSAKQLVAEKVARIVRPHQSILVDTGSTTLICAGALSKVRDLKVITNSARIADVFASNDNGTDVYLLGGAYVADNAQTVGPTAVEEIGRYQADHAILTVTALDRYGVADSSEGEAQVARAMVRSAASVTVVADCSKLGRRATFQVCPLNAIDRLVLDAAPGREFLAAFEAAGIQVL